MQSQNPPPVLGPIPPSGPPPTMAEQTDDKDERETKADDILQAEKHYRVQLIARTNMLKKTYSIQKLDNIWLHDFPVMAATVSIILSIRFAKRQIFFSQNNTCRLIN